MGRVRIAVFACVLNREGNLRNLLGSENWIAQELIDMLISRSELPGLDNMGLAREEEEAVGHSVDLL